MVPVRICNDIRNAGVKPDAGKVPALCFAYFSRQFMRVVIRKGISERVLGGVKKILTVKKKPLPV
jgi:hypothetical protein